MHAFHVRTYTHFALPIFVLYIYTCTLKGLYAAQRIDSVIDNIEVTSLRYGGVTIL